MRPYTEHGQVIRAKRVNQVVLAFWDVSRDVGGIVDSSTDEIRNSIMDAYDNCNYRGSETEEERKALAELRNHAEIRSLPET